MVFHLVWIILTYKFPYRLTNVHGPVLILMQIYNLFSIRADNLNFYSLAHSVISYFFLLSSGLLLNSCWIITVVTNIIVTIGTELYYVFALKIREPGILVYLISISLLMIYCTYQIEYKSKSEFLQLM